MDTTKPDAPVTVPFNSKDTGENKKITEKDKRKRPEEDPDDSPGTDIGVPLSHGILCYGEWLRLDVGWASMRVFHTSQETSRNNFFIVVHSENLLTTYLPPYSTQNHNLY